jgi:hypothetical protein
LQVARHADTRLRERRDPALRLSRHHVTPAFNDDKPYDRFLKKGRSPMRSGTVAMALGRGASTTFGSMRSTPAPCDMELGALPVLRTFLSDVVRGAAGCRSHQYSNERHAPWVHPAASGSILGLGKAKPAGFGGDTKWL